MKPSCLVTDDGSAILCLLCRRISFNRNDAQNRFCGACGWSHNDTPHAVKAYRRARRVALVNGALAMLNWMIAIWDWTTVEVNYIRWIALFTFIVGGFSAQVAWEWGKRWRTMKRFRQFA